MRHISVRVDENLYNQVRVEADNDGKPIAEFVRAKLRQMCGNSAADTSYPSESLTILAAQLAAKDEQIAAQLLEHRKQLADLARQLEEAHRRHEETQRASEEASKRHDTIILQMTQQLDRTQGQLEDLRAQQNVSFWKKLFGGK